MLGHLNISFSFRLYHARKDFLPWYCRKSPKDVNCDVMMSGQKYSLLVLDPSHVRCLKQNPRTKHNLHRGMVEYIPRS